MLRRAHRQRTADAALTAYECSRPATNRASVCNAPFTNLNTVRCLEEVALGAMDTDELRHVHAELSRATFPRRAVGRQWLYECNHAVFERFRDHQLPAWIDEAERRGSDSVRVHLRPAGGAT